MMNEKQKGILEAMKTLKENNILYPSMREITEYLGYKRPGSIQCHIKKMAELGAIKKVGFGTHARWIPNE